MFKVNNKNIKMIGVFVINFEQISYLFLMFLLQMLAA